jgi:transporter family protein
VSDTALGIALSLIASFSWAVGSIFIRLGLNRIGSTTATFLSLVSGFFYVLIVALIVDAEGFLALTPSVVLGFVLAGLLSFLGGRFFYYVAVTYLGVGRATAMGGATPIIAALLAVIFLGEVLTLPLALGIVAVASGVGLIATGR